MLRVFRTSAIPVLLIGFSSEASAQCQPAIQRLNADRRFDEAKAQVSAMLARDSKQSASYECLGRISMAQGRPREAVEHFERAVKLDDGIASHHLWLGNALGNLGDSTSKIKLPFLARRIKGEFERTVALDPSSVEGRLGLVEFYMQAPAVMGGSKDKAQEQIREISKLNPMRGHLKSAELHAREKRIAEQEKELIAAEKAAPDSAVAGYALGSFYQATQRWSDAFAMYDRMVRQFPGEWLVRFQVGRTAALSGEQLERGEKELRALIATPPPDMSVATRAGAHHRLGMILEKLGRKDQARAEYQLAVSINPRNEEAKRSLAAVK